MAAVLAAGLILAACGDDESASTEPAATEASAPAETSPAAEPSEASPTTAAPEEEDRPEAAPGSGTDVPEIGIGSPSPDICRDREYKIGFNVFSDTDAVAAVSASSLEDLAERLGCVEVISAVDGTDPAQVVSNIESFVQQGVDGVITFNVVDAGGPPSYEVMEGAGIPYVSLAVTAGEGGVTFIIDDFAAGFQAGQALALEYRERFGESGFPYVILGRFDEVEGGVKRLDGSEAAIREFLPGIPDGNILAVETLADPANAGQRTLDVMSRVPSDAVVLITGINDDNIFAMLQSVRQSGFSDENILVGTQGTAVPSGVQFVCENEPYIGGVDFFANRYMDYVLPGLLALISGERDLVPDPIVGPTGWLNRDEIAAAHPDLCGN